MRVRGTLKVGLLPALCALAFAGPAAAGNGGSHDVPLVGTAPTIDGVVGTPEWDAATSFTVTFGNFIGTAYVERTASDLYIALTVTDPGGPGDAAVYFDNNDDGVTAAGDDLIVYNQFDGAGSDWYATDGAFGSARDTFGNGTNDVTAAQSYTGNVQTFEFRHPLCNVSDATHDFCFTSKVGFTIGYRTPQGATGTSYLTPAQIGNPAGYGELVIPSTPPPAPTITLQSNDAGHPSESLSFNGDTYNAWYRGGVGGSFALGVPANDDPAGITSAAFPAQLLDASTGAQAAGWSSPSSTDLTRTYAFTESAAQPASIAVTDSDKNGLTSPARTVGFTQDSSPPNGSLSCLPEACTNSAGAVVITVNAADRQSGIDELRYTLDGTDPGPSNGATIEPEGTIRIIKPNVTVKLWGIDRVGNATQIGSVSASGLPDASDPQPGPAYLVNTSDDHNDTSGCTFGDCSLREAILATNAGGVATTIAFAISDGVQTISMRSPLPAITRPVTIDGTSQPGVLAGPGIVLDGSTFESSAAGITLGGGSSTVRGLAVSRFNGNGLIVRGDDNHVVGNVIGTSPDGSQRLGNSRAGIELDGATRTEVSGNLVSGSGGPGILVTGGATGATIRDNRIGTDANGDPADEGNAGAGIQIDSGSSGTAVGGPGRADGNRIADNGGAGVSVGSAANPILGNSIEGNGGEGIDLGTTGNQLQAAPVVTAARQTDGGLTVVGTLASAGGTYRIEYFGNDFCPDGGPTQGATYLGSTQLVVATGGVAALNATLEGVNVAAGSGLTVTATSAGGNTSAFSACRRVTTGGTASSSTLGLTTNTATTQPGAAVVPLADIPPTAFANTSTDSNGATASAPLGAIPLGAIPLGAIPLGAIPLGAIPLGAIGFTPQSLLQDGLGGVPLNTIPLKEPLSWETELQGTPLAGLPVQTLTLRDVLSLSPPPANLTTAGPGAIGLKDLDLSLSPLGAIPLGAIALGSTPLGAIPISGDPTKTTAQNVADWCAQIRSLPGFGATDCTSLNGQTVMGVAIQGVPLGAIPLGAIPLGAIPLGAIPLGAIPLGAIDLAGSPLGAIPLGAISLGLTPLGAIPLGAIPLGAIPLGAIPLGAIPVLSHVVDCTLGFSCTAPGATLAGAAAAHAIKPGATLADLGAYGAATLGDLAAYLQAHPEIQLKDVVAGLPDTLTLRDLLAALMGGTPPSWEQFPLDGLQDFAGKPGASGGVVTYSAAFTIQGQGSNAIATLSIAMPAGARYVPGSAVLTDAATNGSRAPGDPIFTATGLSWTLDTLAYGHAYTLAFTLRAGLTLGNEHEQATLSTAGVSNQTAQADVTVGDTFESNNTPAQAPPISASTLYVSYLGNGKDVDYSSFAITPANAPAGTRVKIFLSHLHSDADLAVFGPVDSPLRSAPLGAIPLGAIPAGEQPVKPGEKTQQLAPDTAQDLPIGSLPAGDQLLGVSDTRGTADEEVDFTSTGQTGALLIQVSSYDGRPTTDPYVVRVELDLPPALPPCTQAAPAGSGVTEAAMPAPASIPTTAQTLILFDERRLGQTYNQADAHTVFTKLQAYAARSDVNGVIVPVEANAAVAGAYGAWDANLCSPAAANGVVRAIGTLLDSLQAGHPSLKTVVVVGADNVIPMGRLLDQTQQANELGFRSTFGFVNNEYVGAVAAGYLLSDDPFADPDPQQLLGGYLYVPKLALGRLVETPADIVRQLDAYAASNGLANPQTKLVSGYDFLTDGSQAVDTALGRTAPTGTLINDTWTADGVRSALFPTGGPAPLLDSLNAHYDQHRALSANGNAIHDESPPSLFTTTDIATHGANGVLGRIVFTMGCHAGFSLFDNLTYFTASTPADFTLDWPQAYIEGGAIEFMGNTGYGLGDTATVAYSERLNQLFAQRLNGTMSVGEALAYAKQEYFGGLGVVSLYDAKVGNEATLYGIPTYRLGTGTPPAAPLPAPTQVDAATGLTSVDFSTLQTFTLHSPTLNGTPLGSYYSANDPNGAGQQVTNRRPIEPSTSVDVTEPGTIAHGVLVTSLASHDIASLTAAFGRVADDSSAIEPQLQGIVDFPASIQSVATIATPNGQSQRAVLIAGHFASGAVSGVGKQRLYDRIGGTVLYSTSADFVRPTITGMQVLKVGSTVGFAADVADLTQTGAAGVVTEAIVLYLDASGSWQRANLSCTSGHCAGGGPLAGSSVDYIAEAVDGSGNVGVNANKATAANVAPPAGSQHLSVSFSGAQASSGWFTGPVTATIASDNAASISSSLDGGPFRDGTAVLVSGDGLHVLVARGSDGSEATFSVPIDTGAPTAVISTPHDGAILFIGDRYTVDYSCADGGAGIAASGGCAGTLPAGAQLPTLRLPGSYTFTVRATDVVGRTSTTTSTYALVPGIAFLPPVLGGPVLNVVKAGRTIPVLFSLLANLGLNVFDPGYPRSQQVACPSGLFTHPVDDDAVTTPGLRYNTRTTVYTYGFATDPSWAGTCRELSVKFRYGSVRTIRLKFK